MEFVSFDSLENIDPILNILPTTEESNITNVLSTEIEPPPSQFKLPIEQLSLWHNEIELNQVEKLAKNADLTVARRSNATPNNTAQILLGDSMGEMLSYFAISDIVFMGGSLNQTGGHNMLEPAAHSKAIIFGPNVFNFAEISADLLNNQASIQVQNAQALFTQIISLLGNSQQLEVLGKNAKQYFDSQKGAVKKIAKLIKNII